MKAVFVCTDSRARPDLAQKLKQKNKKGAVLRHFLWISGGLPAPF